MYAPSLDRDIVCGMVIYLMRFTLHAFVLEGMVSIVRCVPCNDQQLSSWEISLVVVNFLCTPMYIENCFTK